jgi:nucleoside-diphosphate-sugar epimerase
LKLLVTGASGFVGRRVAVLAQERGHHVIKQLRQNAEASDIICHIDGNTDWPLMDTGVECVIHCAARVHQMNESDEEAAFAYQQVNVEGSLNLARQALRAGVKRFVFISSIKVNGEFTVKASPFTEDIAHSPSDYYGQSKYQAEMGLRKIAKETGLDVVIIRPPLVYGPGVNANFASMIKAVDKGIPLPFGAINNQRSLIYLDNLVDFILCCSTHGKAAGETFLVSDGQDVSTTQLLQTIAKSLGHSSRLIPVPVRWIQGLLSLIGKKAIGQRLLGSLQLDISKAKTLLGWSAPVSFEQGIESTITAYLAGEKE